MRFELYPERMTRFGATTPKKWRWRLKASNGKIVADSGEAYSSKKSATAGITIVMLVGVKTPIVEVAK